jgi:aspartyl-tRNA(Asn)/glutamyl-tRNA(Gln) amidotransferase subunit A
VASDPTELTLTELTAALGRRALSPLEVTEAYLDRIERLDPQLGTHVTLDAEGARTTARALESDAFRGRPLYGAPIAPKDLFATRGLRTTGGSKILADWVPGRDAAAVARLRAAGAVFTGKLNTHEFALGGTTQNPWHGNTRNPWDADRVPGGSSGGSAAAVAASLAAGTISTDTGGSSRIPAHCCGVVGLKPTFGRLSTAGLIPLAWSLDHVGLMTKTVADAALLYAALSETEAWAAPVSAPGGPQPLAGLRVGLPAADFLGDCEPEVAGPLQDALRVLEELGARVTLVALPEMRMAEGAQWGIVGAEAAAFHRRWIRERPADYGADVLTQLRAGALLSAEEYLKAQQIRRLVTAQVSQTLREVDLVFMPVLPIRAPTLEAVASPSTVINGVETPMFTVFTGYCSYANITGVPALAIPADVAGDAQPVGFQLLAGHGREALLLEVGQAFERERPRSPLRRLDA